MTTFHGEKDLLAREKQIKILKDSIRRAVGLGKQKILGPDGSVEMGDSSSLLLNPVLPGFPISKIYLLGIFKG